ncbi:MAG: DinB family protein [Bacteroidota bacterium]
MDKSSLAIQLREAYTPILELAASISKEDFDFTPSTNRWIAGQHLQHLILSTKPINKLLRFPKTVLEEKFGLNNRAERSYEATVEKYRAKLQEGGRATDNFIPETLDFAHKDRISAELKRELEQLLALLEEWSEEDLSKYVLPHPLLGLLSIRELFGFTTYHTQHHTTILEQEYLGKFQD